MHRAKEKVLQNNAKKNAELAFSPIGGTPEATWEWLKGANVDCAILDCTHGYTGRSRDRYHMFIETVWLSHANENIMQQLLQLKQQVHSDISTVVEQNILNPVSVNDLASKSTLAIPPSFYKQQ